MPKDQSQFVTVREFLEIVGPRRISRLVLYRNLRNGSIPSIRLGKRKVLIPRSVLAPKTTAK